MDKSRSEAEARGFEAELLVAKADLEQLRSLEELVKRQETLQ